ncbi:MAG: hypothetical protein VKN72_12500 [Nostocales cyanobacterium 94392]|nr:hypothetical protein [Nostocales cyanobacterium 94392]
MAIAIFGVWFTKSRCSHLEINNSYSGIKRRTDLVQCSASAPFVAFKDDYSPQMANTALYQPWWRMGWLQPR